MRVSLLVVPLLPDPPTGNPYPVPDAMVSDEEHYAMGLYEGYEAGWAACEPAALPDERLREADRKVILEWAKFTRDESMGYWGKEQEAVYQRFLGSSE